MSYFFDAVAEAISGTLTTTVGVDAAGTNQITLACWVKKTLWDASIDRGFIGVSDAYNNAISLQLYTNAADTVNHWSRGTGSNYRSIALGATDYDAEWVLVAGVYSNDTLRDLYIENSTNTDTSTVDADVTLLLDSIVLGNDQSRSSAHADGWVAECCIWDTALSTENIDALQTATGIGTAGGPVPSSILPNSVIGYWPLDQDYGTGAGAVTNEASGTSADATGDLTVVGATYAADHPIITGGVGINTIIMVPPGPPLS